MFPAVHLLNIVALVSALERLIWAENSKEILDERCSYCKPPEPVCY